MVVIIPNLRRLFAIGLMVLLAGCQTSPPVLPERNGEWLTDPTIFNARQQDLLDQTRWQYLAKVGLRIGRQSEQANLSWLFADQQNSVSLFGPFGAGAIKVEFDAYGVQLSDRQGVLHRGTSAEAMLSDIVGWPLPIQNLSYWLFVLPSPDSAFSYALDDQDRVRVLRQAGWQIEYSDYQFWDGRLLPRKLVAIRDLPVAGRGEVRVRLITKSWIWEPDLP